MGIKLGSCEKEVPGDSLVCRFLESQSRLEQGKWARAIYGVDIANNIGGWNVFFAWRIFMIQPGSGGKA